MTTVIDQALLRQHGITDGEYARIQELLGREPNLLELGLFSVMWSEHCSYKSSRVHLKTLPTTGPRVVQGPGENAGAVDIGDGLAAVFKIESHNHPSFIEPYQGAATGVGGIIRDIFTMGARPVALLNALRFGSLDTPLARRIFEGVVAGIGGYGNSIGIPTIGGEIVFDEVYAGNPLVNVLCLGLARHDEIIKGQATGVGNPVYYVGAKTGRDGIHGATMASAEFDEASAEKRPAVQVGDPFMEKLLMEACLEVMKTDALVGIQDMGAAGLTCATCEMSSRGGSGMDVEVSLVPQRETGMTPYEIMLSESQERMLLVAKAGREREVEAVFEKWDLHAVRIGHVTDTGRVRLHHHGVLVADVPTTRAHRRRPGLPPADGASGRGRPRCSSWTSRPCPRRRRRRRRSRRCWPRRSSPASAGPTSSSTTRSAPTPSRSPDARPASCASRARGRGWRCRSTATAATATSIRTVARCSRWPSRPATSRAPAASRSARPTTSTSATPSGRRSCGSSARPSAASATPAAPSTCRSPAATSASTTRPKAGPSIRRPCWASSACSRTRAQTVTRAFQSRRRRRGRAGRQSRRARRHGVPGPDARGRWPARRQRSTSIASARCSA